MVDFGVDGRRAAGAVSRDGERIGVEEEERAFRSFVVLYPVAVDEVTGWVTTLAGPFTTGCQDDVARAIIRCLRCRRV